MRALARSSLIGAWLLSGCAPNGTLGAPCIKEGTGWHAGYVCYAPLVCNSGRQPPLCETAHAGGLGAPCGADINCETQLWCLPTPAESSCATRLLEGEPCPSGQGCALDLTCVKSDAGIACQR